MTVYDQLKNYYNGRRVLVTGSTGFKGSWLCAMLKELGAEVYGYALEPSTDPNLWEILGLDTQVEQTMADIRDQLTLMQTFAHVQPQSVLHLAAQPLVIDSYKDPCYTYETNVMGTVNVLECVRACEATTSFLNVTTDKVYENREIEGYGYQEADKLDGFDPYSNSKSCSELVTHSYVKSFFAPNAQGEAAGRCAISTARAGNVIGGGDFSANRIVPDCVRAAISSKSMLIRNPNSVRPYQHVLEPLVAYLMIVATQDADHTKAGWYNIGPDLPDGAKATAADYVTSGALVKMFAKAWGEGFTYELGNVDGPHEANFLLLDNALAKQTFGWHPTWDVCTAITKTVEWTRAWQEGQARQITNRQIKDYLGEL